MSDTPRWVIVDDRDSDIQYLGTSWFLEVGRRDSVGRNGSPYLSTLHGTNSSASFAFNFTGTAVRVVGSNLHPDAVESPWYSCRVNGVDITTASDLPDSLSNNFVFCSTKSPLDGGLQSLTVNAVLSLNRTAWFDRIEYIPPKQASLEQKVIRVEVDDPQVSTWQVSSGTTETFFVRLPFYGISAACYGRISSTFNTNWNNLSWSIDNANASRIWSRPTQVNLSNHQFFESPTYPLGEHTLVVEYVSNLNTPELGVEYFVVQNGTLPSTSSSTLPASSTTSTATAITPGNLGAAASGAIAGGIIGVVLIFSIALFYFCRRRRKRIEINGFQPIQYRPDIPANMAVSSHSHLVHRKSPLLPIHRANANLPLSDYGRTPMNEDATTPSNEQGQQSTDDPGPSRMTSMPPLYTE